ncbi:MAG TPA: hypothetical protein VF605_12055 [Allosphingosinicella sp.]|jgi:hypothetical protein
MGKSTYIGVAVLTLLAVPATAEAKWKGDNGKTYTKLEKCLAANYSCSVARLVMVADFDVGGPANAAARSRSGASADVAKYVVVKPGTRPPAVSEGKVEGCLTKGGSVHGRPCTTKEEPIVIYEH